MIILATICRKAVKIINMLSAIISFFGLLFSVVCVYSIDVHYVNTIQSSNKGFGASVDMYNDTMVVGTVGRYSNTGNYANIYQKRNEIWDLNDSIELTENGWFGYALSVNNKYCAVGGYAADKVYIYEKNDDQTYKQQVNQVIKNTAMHEYGKSVSLSENYMIVGAPSSNNYAYIYQLQDDTYTLVRSITEYTSESQFGISVDITDDYAIVGSNNKAFIFTNNQNNWDIVVEIDGYTNENNFGNKVVMQNDYAVVSAYGSNKVFLFDKYSNGTWNKQAYHVIDQYTSDSEFGYSISIYNDMLLVGARGSNKAYLFGDLQNTSNVFVFDDFVDQTGFGYDVVISDSTIAITSMKEQKVYLFHIGYDPPTLSPTSRPSMNPTSRPSTSPTSRPSMNPTQILVEEVSTSNTPTSFPTQSGHENTLHTSQSHMNRYVTVMGVSIAAATLFILGMFYIIRQYKKYNSVHIEEYAKEPDFTSIYDMEDAGWQKTVHPIHLQYDSDEESQIIGPIHQKYRQTLSLPV